MQGGGDVLDQSPEGWQNLHPPQETQLEMQGDVALKIALHEQEVGLDELQRSFLSPAALGFYKSLLEYAKH